MKIKINTYSMPNFPSFIGSSPAQKREMQERKEKVTAVLNRAIAAQRKITINDIVKETGYSQNKIYYLFKRNADVNALWQKVQNDFLSEEQIRKMEAVQSALQEARENKERASLKDISQKTNVSAASVSRYANKPAMSPIWYWVKLKEHTPYTEKEIQEQNLAIQEQLELAVEHKKAILLTEIEAQTGINTQVIQDRIDSSETLTALHDETISFTDKNYKLEVAKIMKVLQSAQASGLKVSIKYITDKTSIPRNTVEARIKQNSRLNGLFEKTRAVRRQNKEEAEADDKKLEAALEKAVENGEKLTYAEAASRAGLDLKSGTISNKIERSEELSALWKQARAEECPHDSKDEIEAKIKRVEQILLNAYENGEKLTSKQLVEKTGITKSTLFSRIGKSELLSTLWELTCAKPNGGFSDDEIEFQNIIIEQILRQRIQDKMTPTFNQIGDYLDLKGSTVKQRIEGNPTLLALYLEGGGTVSSISLTE